MSYPFVAEITPSAVRTVRSDMVWLPGFEQMTSKKGRKISQ
jgi:hypothetical protein